jgi:hypothetical protein
MATTDIARHLSAVMSTLRSPESTIRACAHKRNFELDDEDHKAHRP